MFSFFCCTKQVAKQVLPIKCDAYQILERLIHQVDSEISKIGIDVPNALGKPLFEVQMELDFQTYSLSSKVKALYTTNGPCFCTTSIDKMKPGTLIQIATKEEIQQYLLEVANMVILRKTTNCVGFAALVMKVASELTHVTHVSKLSVHNLQLF